MYLEGSEEEKKHFGHLLCIDGFRKQEHKNIQEQELNDNRNLIKDNL